MKCPKTSTPSAGRRHLRSVLGSALLISLLLNWATAQPGTRTPAASLRPFLAALADNPELAAAQAALEAAEAQLNAARDPVALEATGGYSRTSIDESKLVPAQQVGAQQEGEPSDPGFAGGTLPATGFQVATTLRFRPLPFGDIADLVTQRELELESSRLALQSARAGLEARALEAALSSRLAERSVALAEEGLEAATQGLIATRTRYAKGAANERDLRGAEEARLEAQTLLENARIDAETARLNLTSLVGDTPAPSFADLAALTPPASGVPTTVRDAQIQTQLAALGLSAAQRELYPVAQASYNWNVSDTSSLTASLESRTLQPSLGYAYQDPGRTSPANAVVGTFQIGISANISLSTLDALKAVERQQVAAQEGLRAQRQGGALQGAALQAAYTKAARTATLERRAFGNAQLTYQEDATRQELGLSAPLETQTSLIELLQADLERRNSELSSLTALLDIYELYGLPPSEALP